MTLRELLKMVDLDLVYSIINERDRRLAEKSCEPTLERTIAAYDGVIKELLSNPKVKAYSMPIHVEDAIDFWDKKTPYIDVYLRNPRYVDPPKGAEPWGGVRGKKIPKGTYNMNLSKYNKRYSFMGIRWSKLIDTPVELCEVPLEKAIAQILWELTWDGWTEESAAKNNVVLIKKLDASMKEIKEGKSITLPSKKKGGWKVVIPDSVNKQFMDIINKKKE